MSISLPVVTADSSLVETLLDEQQTLTAVERFSQVHESKSYTPATTETPETNREPAQARYYRSLLPATSPNPGQQYAFEVNLDQCSGCKACVVACHTLNGLEDDESWRRVGTMTIGQYEEPHRDDNSAIGIQHLTTACHHCEDPGCLNGCPVKAYDKDPETGIVRHLDDQCIGCKYCTMMCPYEVPQYSDRLGIVRKCDMCHNRLSVGEAPACVQSCPNEAISIRIIESDTETFESGERLAAGAPASSITKPTTRYTTARSSRIESALPQDAGIDPVAESHWPLAVMLVATQASVGIILFERIATALSWISGNPLSVDTSRYSATLSLLAGGIGLNIAPLHLGQPLRAWRVFLGLRTSWLSREAIVLGKYMGILTVAVALLWIPVFPSYVPSLLTERTPVWAADAMLFAALPLGLIGLFTSGMIYIATKRQIWRSSRTLTRFIGTAIISGSTLFAATWVLDGGTSIVTFAFLLLAALCQIGKMAWEWTICLKPRSERTSRDSVGLFDYDDRSRLLISKHLRNTATLRIRLGLAAVGILTMAMLLSIVSPALCMIACCVAGAIVISGELAERLIYFQSVVVDRMPGTLR